MTESVSSVTHFLSPGVLGLGFPGGYEWLILLILGLLIFGRRLPEVGRSLGRSIVEFKKGIKGIDDEIESESNKPDDKPQVTAASRQELPPQPSPPAEPRVSRDPLAAAGLDDSEPEEVRQSSSGGSDADRGSG